MERKNRVLLFVGFIILTVFLSLFIILGNFIDFKNILKILLGLGYIILTIFLASDIYHFAIEGKRGDSTDLVAILYFFDVIFLLTDDIMTSIIGAFSIYMIFGIRELKDYEVLNKLLLISVITYNFIFIAGIINVTSKRFGIIDTNVIRDTAYSMAIWVMLILGFALFGRKYIVVFRFMSPQYLTMFLFIIAWMAVRYISDYIFDITQLIYFFLIITNWVVYLLSGSILDFTLGIKRTYDPRLNEMVEEVKERVGLKDKIRVGFGKYPILNAMAYGSLFDRRIAIIAPDINTIPEDELKGIIAHELNHSKGGIKNIPDTLMLSIVSTIELLLFWILKWPATIYDYTFAPENQPFPLWVFILLNILISIILYVFVRILEGFADNNSKKQGFSFELAKGLYNLEGFYASGREMGLDTMLLSEEEVTEENKISNYATTAEYIYLNMISPSSVTLLSNMLNSHPPTYHRIISMLNNSNYEVTPLQEAILPFKLLRKKSRNTFKYQHIDVLPKFRELSNNKFKEMFAIEDYGAYLENLNKKELFKKEIGKLHLVIDLFNPAIFIGFLEDVILSDDICVSYKYLIRDIHSQSIHYYDTPEFNKFKKGMKKKEREIQKSIDAKSKDIKLITSDLENRRSLLNKQIFRDEIKQSDENSVSKYDQIRETIKEQNTVPELRTLPGNTTILFEIDLFDDYYVKKYGKVIFDSIYLPKKFKEFNDLNHKIFNNSYLEPSEIDLLSLGTKYFENLIKNHIYAKYLISNPNTSEVNEVLFKIKNGKIPFPIKKINNAINKEVFIQDGNQIKIYRFKGIKENIPVDNREKDLKKNINVNADNNAENNLENSIENKINKGIEIPESKTDFLSDSLIFINERYINNKNNNSAENNDKAIINTRNADENNPGEDSKQISISLKNAIVKTGDIVSLIRNDKISIVYEKEIFKYLKEKQLRTTIYLKKAVNNQETGRIIDFEITEISDNDGNYDGSDNVIIVKSVYNKQLRIPLKQLEAIVFTNDTFMAIDKSKLSLGSKVLEWFAARNNPNLIFYG